MRKAVYGLNEVKEKIKELKGQSVKLSINRGRKKIDIVTATINDVYPSVFTIKIDEKLQTFSYFDVLCSDIVFNESSLPPQSC